MEGYRHIVIRLVTILSDRFGDIPTVIRLLATNVEISPESAWVIRLFIIA